MIFDHSQLREISELIKLLERLPEFLSIQLDPVIVRSKDGDSCLGAITDEGGVGEFTFTPSK
jgi:hypothetical protein